MRLTDKDIYSSIDFRKSFRLMCGKNFENVTLKFKDGISDSGFYLVALDKNNNFIEISFSGSDDILNDFINLIYQI